MAGSHIHNPTHNLRTNITILRKNKHANQQKKIKKRRVNHGNTVSHNSSHTNIWNNNINLTPSTPNNTDNRHDPSLSHTTNGDPSSNRQRNPMEIHPSLNNDDFTVPNIRDHHRQKPGRHTNTHHRNTNSRKHLHTLTLYT